MSNQKTAIYCRPKTSNNPEFLREELDKMYFRLAAFAHAHKMLIISYYEDTELIMGNRIPARLSNLLVDYEKGLFDTILVTNYKQISQFPLPHILASTYSIDSSERAKMIYILNHSHMHHWID